VLYVAGWGRTGSTLLEVWLGQVPGFCATGELVYLWSRGLGAGERCGCGDDVAACPLWARVLAEAFDRPADGVAGEMRSLERRLVRTRHLPGLLTRREPNGMRRAALERYVGNLSALYRAISVVTGSHVLVDSSKLPAYGAVLERAAELDVSVVHVVRDPRAVAYSWSTRGKNAGIAERIGLTKSSAYWSLFNAATEALWGRDRGRYLRIRYEDLVADPRRVFADVMALVGEQPATTPFTGSHSAFVEPTHSVGGNPTRFRTGVVEITPDTTWRHAMPRRSARWVSALTLPLLPRYGYRLHAGGDLS
jgi:hypothetical protein